MTAQSLPAKGEALPVIDPASDFCADCGDFIAWCPYWVARWPHLESHREAV